jgi:hypothetical protein
MCSGVSTERDMAASSILAVQALDWPSARLSSRLTGALSGRRATGGALLSHSRCHSPLLFRMETTLRILKWVLPTTLRVYGLRPSGKTKGSTLQWDMPTRLATLRGLVKIPRIFLAPHSRRDCVSQACPKEVSGKEVWGTSAEHSSDQSGDVSPVVAIVPGDTGAKAL